MIPGAATLAQVASASPATTAMQSFVTPIVITLCVLASLACVFFLIWGGIQYMSSTGKPENLETAKKTIKNALIGLVLVLAAATLTAILSHAYVASGGAPSQKLPELVQIQQKHTGISITDAIVSTIIGVLRNIIESIGQPFLSALSYFTNSTALMGDNATVFNLWLAVVGITDVLLVLAVILLGFHVMSFSVFGFDEIDIKQLLPQFALIFILLNTSIFIIDGVIGLSNAMIYALQSGFESISVWDTLAQITKQSSDLGLAGLLVMVSFLVVSVMLLIYYVGRLIALYVGAILSPLIFLLWLIPAFKDFAITAMKAYLMLIFVLFVHAVIILLAASIFSGMLQGNNSGQPNTLMALILGLATVLALLKTQGVMQEYVYASTGPRAARAVATSFMRGATHLSSASKIFKKQSNSQRSNNRKRIIKPHSIIQRAQIRRVGIQNQKLRTGETQRATNIQTAETDDSQGYEGENT